MKFLCFLLISIGIAMTMSSGAQNEMLYSFDFADSIPTGWNVSDSTNNGFNWIHTYNGLEAVYNEESASQLNSTSNANGWLMLHAAYYNTDTIGGLSEVNPLVNMNSTITSAPLDFSEETAVFVQLEHNFRSLSNPSPGSLELGISNNGIDWTVYDLHTGSDAPLNLQQGIETLSFDISSVAAQEPEVWVRFHFRDLAWHFWCIDDLVFSDSSFLNTTDYDKTASTTLLALPNPTTDFVTIEQVNNQYFELFSTTGKLLHAGRTNGSSIDFRPYKNGIYILRFKDSGSSLKVVKQN